MLALTFFIFVQEFLLEKVRKKHDLLYHQTDDQNIAKTNVTVPPIQAGRFHFLGSPTN